MPFKQLHPLIQEKLISSGMIRPTEAQQRAIPEILNGSHVLLIAPTGIGKTEAAVLPIFHRFLKLRDEAASKGKTISGISILYITPLRALNRDMLRRMKEWGESLNINVAVRHGDTTSYQRTKQSRNPPDFLITTPETLQIMLTGKRLREHLGNVKAVVVDEIHELATDDRGAQLMVALERVAERAGEFQRIGLSATVGDPVKVGNFLGGIRRHISIVQIAARNQKEVLVDSPEVTDEDRERATELKVTPELAASLKMAEELITSHRSVLFFTNTRDTAENIASRFSILSPELKIGVHHGSLSKYFRLEIEEGFKKGELQALICTSSLELGIDVGATDLVLQYNSPRQVERFLQRLGRSGHKTDLTSKGIIIATGPDEIAESMVIGRRALVEGLTGVNIRNSPLDVCANQIVAFTMEYGRIEVEKAWEILRRSFPFRHMKLEALLEIVTELSHIGIIWSDGEYIGKGRNSINYFYRNISMIPDQKTYPVRDITTGRIVGTLDEAFAFSLKDYSNFIMRGIGWNYVGVEDGVVLAEPSTHLGHLPDWTGEDIPVPFSVAQEVGEIRRALSEKSILPDEILNNYPISENALEVLIDYIDRQITEGITVPDDRLITVENGGKLCIVNACLGSKVNETLGNLLSALISARLGTGVRFATDPYRIIMESSVRIDPEFVIGILKEFQPASLREVLYRVMKNSSSFRWQFFHVARKFGIISHDADIRLIDMEKIMGKFQDSFPYTEAFNKVLFQTLNIRRTREVLRDIQHGRIELRITPVSPIGNEGLLSMRRFMSPERADHSILMALKARLENNHAYLLCMNCGASMRVQISGLREPIRCHRCGSPMIATIPGYNSRLREIVTSKIRKGDSALKPGDKKQFRELMKNASLVKEHGRKAVMVLSARGIGPTTASRILAKPGSDEDEMLKEILRAEVNFARTHQFWD